MQGRNRPSEKIGIVKDDSERGKVLILIVEDSPTQAERLRHILEQNGTEVRMAGNGKEALVEIRRERPRIVITDVVMPEMDGYELCGQIKRDPNLKDIPVILVTSLSDPKDVLKGLECGANSFIVKPYDEEYLLSRIRYVLANEELRKTESFKMGIEIYFAGQKYFITSDRVQILDLLLSTYESAILRNFELAQVQEELRKLNEDLDLKVRERTANLATEIAERQRTEEALRVSQSRFAGILDIAADAIISTDATRRIILFNQGAEKIFGYQVGEVLSKPLDMLIPHRFREVHQEHIQGFASSGTTARRMNERGAVFGIRKDGSEFPAEVSISQLEVESEKIFTVMLRDISEPKQAEALQSALYRIAEKTSLAEDIQEYYAAIHGIVGEVMYAKHFYIALYDDRAETIKFPYFVDEADPEPDPRQAISGLTGYVLRTGEPLLLTQKAFDEMVGRGEVKLAGPPSPFWLGVPLKTAETTFGVLAVQSYSEDIRFGKREKEILTFVSQHVSAAIERKRQEAMKAELEKQFLQTQKMEAVGLLAGGVAHDFNNILMAVNGYSELLLMQTAENDPLRRNVLEIQKVTGQGAQLTRQLLAFSRKQILSPKILDLNHSISQIENMLQRLVGEDVGLSTVCSKELGHIKADPGQIEQVIMNLAVNARDAMPQGGKLTIETARIELDNAYASTHAEVKPGRYIMLAVSDTGCGMDEATLSRIFEPFFTTKEEGKGTGLGLSTVY